MSVIAFCGNAQPLDSFWPRNSFTVSQVSPKEHNKIWTEKALMGKFHSLINLEIKQENASLLLFIYEKYSQHVGVSEPHTEILC